MPAETVAHRRTWMQWPARPGIYGGSTYLQQVRGNIARLARAIAGFEEVILCARPEHASAAAKACGKSVRIEQFELDDMWARDAGPTFVVNHRGEVAVVDLNFNGWGDKQTHADDANLVRAISTAHGFTRFRANLVTEGGAVEVDGEGTILTTESSVWNANRNPGKTRDLVTNDLKEALGGKSVIWLPGLRGRDITDGHIDGFARFIDPGHVLVELHADHSRTPEAHMAREALKQLQGVRDAKGRRLRVSTIENAGKTRVTSPDFLNAYINYYVCNGAVLVPQFGDRRADDNAVSVLGDLYPGRKIVQLDVDRIHENGGGIHCTTQQQPAGPIYKQ